MYEINKCVQQQLKLQILSSKYAVLNYKELKIAESMISEHILRLMNRDHSFESAVEIIEEELNSMVWSDENG